MYEELVLYRNQIADEIDIPPFLVASNKLLGNLSLSRPSCPEKLREVEGVSDQWIPKFGFKMLKRYKSFSGKTLVSYLMIFLKKLMVLMLRQ